LAIVIEEIGGKERSLIWIEGLLSFDLAPVLMLLAVLTVLYRFRSIVIGFSVFSVKLVVTVGILIFLLQFFPPVDEIKKIPLIASIKGS